MKAKNETHHKIEVVQILNWMSCQDIITLPMELSLSIGRGV